MDNCSPVKNNGCGCALWFGGWLYTIGYAKLLWWQAVIGTVIWPYYLALAMHGG